MFHKKFIEKISACGKEFKGESRNRYWFGYKLLIEVLKNLKKGVN
jgi:hypothetical protein